MVKRSQGTGEWGHSRFLPAAAFLAAGDSKWSTEKRFSFRAVVLDCRPKRFSNRKGNEDMKTKFSVVALVASTITIAQANPGVVSPTKVAPHGGAVARSAPAVQAPVGPGGVSSFRSTPMWSQGSRSLYSGQ